MQSEPRKGGISVVIRHVGRQPATNMPPNSQFPIPNSQFPIPNS